MSSFSFAGLPPAAPLEAEIIDPRTAFLLCQPGGELAEVPLASRWCLVLFTSVERVASFAELVGRDRVDVTPLSPELLAEAQASDRTIVVDPRREDGRFEYRVLARAMVLERGGPSGAN